MSLNPPQPQQTVIPPSSSTIVNNSSTSFNPIIPPNQQHQCTPECNHHRYSPTVVFGKQLMNNNNNIPVYNVTNSEDPLSTPPQQQHGQQQGLLDEDDILSPTSLAMNHLNKKKQTKRGIGLWKKQEKRLSVNTSNLNSNSNDTSPNMIDNNEINFNENNSDKSIKNIHHNNSNNNNIQNNRNNNNNNNIQSNNSHSNNNTNNNQNNHSNTNNQNNIQNNNNNIQSNENDNNINELNNSNENINVNGFNPFGTPEPLVPSSPIVGNGLGRSFSFHTLKENGNTEVVFVPHSLENSQHCFHCKDHEEELHSFEIYDKLLMNNIEYVREKTRLDSEYFKKHKQTQKPKFLLIGCSDSRVSCESIVKTDPGQMFIHRNVANIVVNTDLNLMSVLQYAVEVLEIKHIIVMGHTRCGGVKAALENTSHGLIDKWLRNIKDVYRLHKQEVDSIQDEEKRWQRMIELNVIEQTLNICKTSIIQKAWAKGKPIHVHGWVYDISSGLVQDLEIEENLWAPIESIYRIEFPDVENYVHE